LNYEELSGRRKGETSSCIKKRVLKTRRLQENRFNGNPSNITCNACLNAVDMEKYCVLSKGSEELLKTAILELGISARAYDKILKISRTIADMDEADTIESHHISEAIGYRCLDRNLWVT